MFYRRDAAVALAVSTLLACAGYATAGTTESAPTITLDAAVVAPADAAPPGLLMQGLDRMGVGKQLNDAKINFYGWLEVGYTVNPRRIGKEAPLFPGPFNHEVGNHFMLNQFVLGVERTVDGKKFDVGGKVEVMYGTDSNGIHANGLKLGNETSLGAGDDASNDDRYDPKFQFDITQAYVDVGVPIGNGLVIRAGKFVTLLSYESIAPQGNPFYSHSYMFSAVPATQTGILGMYTLNDQWSFKAGITRGWDEALKDNNGAIDFLGQVTFNPMKNVQAILNLSVGPQNEQDNSHYRTAIDPIITWQVTDQLKLAAEFLYVYDGGMQGDGSDGFTHAYGDVWGAAVYASYKINDYVTLNGRVEKFHDYTNTQNNQQSGSGAHNYYEITIGTTITPFAKVKEISKALVIRPELRYDFSEDRMYSIGANGNSPDFFRDQWTIGCDVIFSF